MRASLFPVPASLACLKEQHQDCYGGSREGEEKAAGHNPRAAIGTQVDVVARAQGAEASAQGGNPLNKQQQAIKNARNQRPVGNREDDADRAKAEHRPENSHSRHADEERVVKRPFYQARRDSDQQNQAGNIGDDAAQRQKPDHTVLSLPRTTIRAQPETASLMFFPFWFIIYSNESLSSAVAFPQFLPFFSPQAERSYTKTYVFCAQK